jgi:hypothetical protein
MFSRSPFPQLSENQCLWRLILVSLAVILVCMVWSESAGATAAKKEAVLSAAGESGQCSSHTLGESRPRIAGTVGLRRRAAVAADGHPLAQDASETSATPPG